MVRALSCKWPYSSLIRFLVAIVFSKRKGPNRFSSFSSVSTFFTELKFCFFLYHNLVGSYKGTNEVIAMVDKKEIETLTKEFEVTRKGLIALGDESKQHRILSMLQRGDCCGMRVKRYRCCNRSFPPSGFASLTDSKRCRNCQSAERSDDSSSFYAKDWEDERLFCRNINGSRYIMPTRTPTRGKTGKHPMERIEKFRRCSESRTHSWNTGSLNKR